MAADCVMAEKVEEGRRGLVGQECASVNSAVAAVRRGSCRPNTEVTDDGLLGEGRKPQTRDLNNADEKDVLVLGCWRSNARADVREDMRLELYTAQADTACIYRLGYASGYRNAMCSRFCYAIWVRWLATVTRLPQWRAPNWCQ